MEYYDGVFVFVSRLFYFSDGVGAFIMGVNQIASFFLFNRILNFVEVIFVSIAQYLNC